MGNFTPALPPEQRDTTENITFLQTIYAGGNNVDCEVFMSNKVRRIFPNVVHRLHLCNQFFPTTCHNLLVCFLEVSCARTAFCFVLSPPTFSPVRPSVFPPPMQFAPLHVSVFPSSRLRAWQASIPGSSGPSKGTKINKNIFNMLNQIISQSSNVANLNSTPKTSKNDYF